MIALTPTERLLRRLVAAITWHIRHAVSPIVATASSTRAAIEVARNAVQLLWLERETDARIIRRVLVQLIRHRVRNGWLRCGRGIGADVQAAAQAYAALAHAGGAT